MEIVNSPVEWQHREGRTPVQMSEWGRDHWGLLAYVETCEVDHHGLIDWDRMTVSARNWPMIFSARSARGWIPGTPGKDGADYGLRLKRTGNRSNRIVEDHCEVDALMDLVDEGLVTLTMPQPDSAGDYFLKPDGRPLTDEMYPSPQFVTGMGELALMPWAAFRLTPRGREIANRLRAYKATPDTTWSRFDPEAGA